MLFTRLRNFVNGLRPTARERDLRAELDDLYGLLEEADKTMTEANDVIDGLNRAVGLLAHERDTLHRNSLVTIASLLASRGGEMAVGKETVAAVARSNFAIDYQTSADGETITARLVDLAGEDDPPAAVEDAPPARPVSDCCSAGTCGERF